MPVVLKIYVVRDDGQAGDFVMFKNAFDVPHETVGEDGVLPVAMMKEIKERGKRGVYRDFFEKFIEPRLFDACIAQGVEAQGESLGDVELFAFPTGNDITGFVVAAKFFEYFKFNIVGDNRAVEVYEDGGGHKNEQ